MFGEIYLPEWLYMCWPWLVAAMGFGFLLTGFPGVSFLLAIYAGWIVWQRDFI